jgi:hypothetical protein
MQQNPEQMMHIVAAVLGIYFVIFLIAITVIIIPTWFICKKAGFSPWLAFIVAIPFGGLVLLYVLAFAEWKVVPIQQAYLPPYPQPPSFPPAPPAPPIPPQV